MSSDTLLPPGLRDHYDAIAGEVQHLIDDGSYPQAIDRLDMILRGVPDDTDNRMLRAALLSKRGEVYLESEEYDQAREDVEEALRLGWESAEAYGTLAWADYYADALDKAREKFDRALSLSEYDPSLLAGRAMVLIELDELELARVDLTNAIHAGDSGAAAYAMRGEVHVRMGNLEDAERDVRKARELDVSDPDFALSQARLFFVLDQQDKAMAAINDAVEVEDSSLEALLLRSYFKLVAGSSREARADAMHASNAYSDEAFAFIQLAFVELAEGNTPLALKAAERAVGLDPSLPDAYIARGAARQLRGELMPAQQDFERGNQAAPELPMFLFGPYYDELQNSPFQYSAMDLLGQFVDFNQAPSPDFSGMPPGMPNLADSFPFPGLDPMKMLGQVFDDEGNVRGPFKPILQMALRNAPTMLKHVPPQMLKNMGGLDTQDLENVDMSQISPEQLEAQLKEFYKAMQSGQSPADILDKAQRDADKGDNNDG